MAEVTRFPHYHQAENVVTNHVMVMLRTLYAASPKLLEGLLRALCSDEVTVGPHFSQQIAGAHSIPDGLVLQEPLAVFVETKLGAGFSIDQLQRHCRSIADRFSNTTGCYLIALSAGAPNAPMPETVTALAHAHNIKVVNVTFGDLVEQVTAVTAEMTKIDADLREVTQEFVDFVYAQGLVPRQDQFLAAVLTGTSWRENGEHGIYYEPAERNPKWHRAAFLGLYHDRQVSHVGRIVTAVAAVVDETGQLTFDTPEKGELYQEAEDAIRAIIDAGQAYFPDFHLKKHRYYVVDGFEPTDFHKATPGGMMGHRYFDIEAITQARLPPKSPGTEAAQALQGHTFS